MSDYKFEPKPDITAYELAQLVARILKIASHLFVSNLPLELQRHFKPILIEQGAQAHGKAQQADRASQGQA